MLFSSRRADVRSATEPSPSGIDLPRAPMSDVSGVVLFPELTKRGGNDVWSPAEVSPLLSLPLAAGMTSASGGGDKKAAGVDREGGGA